MVLPHGRTTTRDWGETSCQVLWPCDPVFPEGLSLGDSPPDSPLPDRLLFFMGRANWFVLNRESPCVLGMTLVLSKENHKGCFTSVSLPRSLRIGQVKSLCLSHVARGSRMIASIRGSVAALAWSTILLLVAGASGGPGWIQDTNPMKGRPEDVECYRFPYLGN